MKLGFVSSILSNRSFTGVIDFASENGFRCVELACWPLGKAERRYAGVTHIDVDALDDEKVSFIKDYTAKKKVEISALGYYPNPLDPDRAKQEAAVSHLKKVIQAARRLGLHHVNTFVGKDKSKTVEENLVNFQKVFAPIVRLAEENDIKIGIENCPMFFTRDEWPGGNNLASTPAIWRKMFDLIPSPNFGLNYDPSHLVWQQIDYIKPIYEFRERIFHVHIKDARVYQEKLDDVGIMAVPLAFHEPKLPGQGDVDWGKFVSALNDIRYKGAACLEIEDRAYQDTPEDILSAIILSKNYISQFIF